MAYRVTFIPGDGVGPERLVKGREPFGQFRRVREEPVEGQRLDLGRLGQHQRLL